MKVSWAVGQHQILSIHVVGVLEEENLKSTKKNLKNFYENYKTMTLRSSINSKHRKHEENYTKELS